MPSLEALDKVVKNTLQAIENSKQQIFDIAETARKETLRLERELVLLENQAGEVIKAVDALELKVKQARLRLAEVDSRLGSYSEAEVKRAYDTASELQTQLLLLRERENQLRSKRDQLQVTLKNMQQTVAKAENLASQVAVVMDFLSGSLNEVNSQLEGLAQKQNLSIRVIKAQEEERKRVAREIHDGPAQAIANIVLRMEFCEKLLELKPDKVKGELQSLKELVRNTLQDIRKIIFDLRPMALDDLGLVPALRRYLEDYKGKYNLNTEFIFFGYERRLDNAIEVGLFRVVQEALNNVWKHAQANKVVVRLEMGRDSVNILVKDDGHGFDVEQALANKQRESLGLTSMRERVELLGGTFVLRSRPGQGTEILLKVPLKEG